MTEKERYALRYAIIKYKSIILHFVNEENKNKK